MPFMFVLIFRCQRYDDDDPTAEVSSRVFKHISIFLTKYLHHFDLASFSNG